MCTASLYASCLLQAELPIKLQAMGCCQLPSSMRIKAGSTGTVIALVYHGCTMQRCPYRRNTWSAPALHRYAARLHLCG